MAESKNQFQSLSRPAFLFLIATMVVQVADLGVAIFPIDPGKLLWRFDAVGSAAAGVGNLMLIILMIFAVSFFSRSTRGAAFAAIVSGVVALSCMIGIGIFSLDAFQMRAQVAAPIVRGVEIASAQAVWRLGLNGLIAIVFTITFGKAWRSGFGGIIPPRTTAPADTSLLVGGRPPVSRPS